MHPCADCQCPLVPSCRLKTALSEALDAFYAHLDQVSLADLMQGNTGLSRLLKVA